MAKKIVQKAVARNHLSRAAKTKAKQVITNQFASKRVKNVLSSTIKNGELVQVIRTSINSARRSVLSEIDPNALDTAHSKQPSKPSNIDDFQFATPKPVTKVLKQKETIKKMAHAVANTSAIISMKPDIPLAQNVMSSTPVMSHNRIVAKVNTPLDESVIDLVSLDESSLDISNGPNSVNFSLLQTDDSTDEEDEVANRAPPSWSLKDNRIPTAVSQSNLKLSTVDNFFGTKAEHVDLRELFPNINDEEIKRRRSSMWGTPVRYSVLPKY